VKWSKALNGSMGTAALLLPMMVAGESHIQTEAAGTAATASAHVNFKIVIPKVLYLRVNGGNEPTESAPSEGAPSEGAQTVAVMSNSRNVTLNATLRASDSDVHARGVVLGASARKTIAQDALCTLGGAAHAAVIPVTPVSPIFPAIPVIPAIPVTTRPVKAGDRQVICTVSMP
jgi:hypothetical protein